MILIIDNYDSFVHTLARYVCELGLAHRLVRNDQIDPRQVLADPPQAVLISPGPSTPDRAGACIALIRACRPARLPVLGICLGHQAIGAAYGAAITPCAPAHGIAADIHHHGHALFNRLPNPFPAARYHALAIDKMPNGLHPIAHLSCGLNMAVGDDAAKIYGMQFHPESILTHHGHQLLSNFFTLANVPHTAAQNKKIPA